MKKKILTLATVILTLATIMCVTAFSVSAEGTEPSATIAKFNLAFEDNTYLKYAVRFDGVDDAKINETNIGMLYWTDYEGGFVPGTEDYSSKTTGYTEISGVKHYVFEYTHLAAKQLADYIYSVAYIELDDVTYYSEPVKYSALEYAYNRLGKTSEGTDNAELKSLLNKMLVYGASAQLYFDYKEDRLATADFFELTLVGGTLEDGFTSGLYLSTDEITVTAPETSGDLVFDNWTNSLDDTSSADNPLTVKNITSNVTYISNYKTAVKYSEGLVFTSNGDGTCYVSEIGACMDEELKIPPVSPDGDKVTSIGVTAFAECSFTSVEIPDSVTSIEYGAFWGCDSLTSIAISEGLTSIGERAFYSCESLESVAFPESLESIGYAAFYCCYSLANIDLPNGITSIGECAFVVCSAITRIEIPASVTSIGNAAFRGCTSITSFSVDEKNPSYESIGGNLYTKGGETLLAYAPGKTESSFTVPAGVTDIGDSAFWGSISLTNINLPNGIRSIGACAFRDCTALPIIYIPDSVTSIGESAFQYCTSLTSIEIPGSVKTMGYWVFSGCTTLESVEILNGLTSIPYTAFVDCTALKSITIPVSIISIGDYAFDGCTSLTDIYYLGSSADFAKIVIGSSNNNFHSATIHYNNSQGSEALMYTSNGDGTCYVSGIGACTDEELIIPAFSPDGDRVTSIGDYAFDDCTSITRVIIPDSVTSIGRCAFQNCFQLENVVIPYGVESIGETAFIHCSSLYSIDIPGSVTSIGEGAFVYSGLIRVSIGDGVTSIGDSAFEGCDEIREVSISRTITEIGTNAFSGCTEISDVYYIGSETDFAKIWIGGGNDNLTMASINYNW